MSSDIIPFGKYKDRSIREIAAADPQYVQWLTQQAWFLEKYQPIYQLIINNFGEPSETPEHNAMQARFLDRAYCMAFWQRMTSHSEDQHKAALGNQHRDDLQAHCSKNEGARAMQSDIVAKLKTATVAHSVAFEAAADVALTISCSSGINRGLLPPKPPGDKWSDNRSLETTAAWRQWRELTQWFDRHGSRHQSWSYAIEIKPSLGDDYPAVLRQMMQQQRQVMQHGAQAMRWVLLIGRFAAQGATLQQVEEIFKTRSIAVVTADAIEQTLLLD